MIYRMYAIYDKVVGEYALPFFGRSDDEVVRSVGLQVAGDPKSLYYLHASDFVLYWLGNYDTVTGDLISANPDPVLLYHLDSIVPGLGGDHIV